MKLDDLAAKHDLHLQFLEIGQVSQGRRRNGLLILLQMLYNAVGSTVQERWESLEKEWADELPEFDNLAQASSFNMGFKALFCLGGAAPTYRFLTLHCPSLSSAFWEEWHKEIFKQACTAIATRTMKPKSASTALKVIAMVLVHTRKPFSLLKNSDLIQYARQTKDISGVAAGVMPASNLLKAAGIIVEEDFSLVWEKRQGVLTPEEMIAKYDLKCESARQTIIKYLKHKSITLEYVSLKGCAYYIGKVFWLNVEEHHPEVHDLNIGLAIADEWKSRLRSKATSKNSESVTRAFMLVRAMYLELDELARSFPEEWGDCSFRSPVRATDLSMMGKQVKQRVAKMQDRTRTTTPFLHRFVEGLWPQWQSSYHLLEQATQTDSGGTFTSGNKQYVRMRETTDAMGAVLKHTSQAIRIRELGTEKIINCTHIEEDCFWAWVIGWFFRETGLRVSELVEVTALSIYKLSLKSGENAIILNIPASNTKTGCERNIPMSPSLVKVAAMARKRVTLADGTIPLTSAYNPQTGEASPLLPYLFQRKGDLGTAFTISYIRKLLEHAAKRAQIYTPDNELYCPQPHDFRRTFASDAARDDLPVHILAKIMGHSDINTTMRYVATYDEDIVRHYQNHITRRRALRPTSEYREPTIAELEQFSAHFGSRLVALGTCHRPYQTACPHEHACIRCTMLAVDPNQAPQLIQLEMDMEKQLLIAEEKKWIGEADGLKTTLMHLKGKKERIQEVIEAEKFR